MPGCGHSAEAVPSGQQQQQEGPPGLPTLPRVQHSVDLAFLADTAGPHGMGFPVGSRDGPPPLIQSGQGAGAWLPSTHQLS